jgi:hypothetical protein
MQIQRTFLAVFVAASLGMMSDRAAWSQQSDPFAADPFASDAAKLRKRPIRSRTRQPETAKPSVVDRVARMRSGGLQPVDVAAVNESESEKRILTVLGDDTTNAFHETPLEEAIQVISEKHKIPIVVDKRALAEIGLTPDTPISISLKNVTLRVFLRLMLRDLNLTYLVKDDVMQITTHEEADQDLATQMYRLPDNLLEKSGDVLTALQQAVAPERWKTQGGLSTAVTIDHVLIISTTRDVHDQVEDFLNTLIETYGTSVDLAQPEAGSRPNAERAPLPR